MKLLDPLASVLVENPPLARLVLASLELAVAALLLAALLRLLRPRSPRLVSFLWLIVLAKPVFSLVAGSPIAVLRFEAPPIATAARVETSHAADPVARERARHEDLASATASAPDRVGSSPPSVPAPARWLTAIEPARLVLGLWLAGVAFFLARYLFARLRLRRLVAASRPAPAALRSRLAEIARELGLARLPALRVSEELDSPALVGIVRPCVLLPRWLAEQGSHATLEWSLRHELSHLRWLDPLAILARDAATILFHFHPATWWAARAHLEALERACDRDSLRDPADANAYAQGLYEILLQARSRRTRAPLAGALAIATRGRMARRIEALLDGRATRPLTPLAALAAGSSGALVLALGCAVTRSEPRAEVGEEIAKPAPGANLFLLGPSGVEFGQICEAAHGFHNIWGRGHEVEVYRDLFESPSNPFDRRSGDLLVLFLTLEPGSQLPQEFEDVLPSPWSDIRSRLERGETFEGARAARDMQVLALAAPDRARLESLVRGSKPLATVLGAPLAPPGSARVTTSAIKVSLNGTSSAHGGGASDPSLFFLGPLSRDSFERIGKAARNKHNIWGRSHSLQVYEDLFENPSNPFDRHPGDLLVLLLTLESGGQLPEKFVDLLPSPWPDVRSRLERGETFEAQGKAREMSVLVLAAPKQGELEALVQRSERLAKLLGSALEEAGESGHEHGGKDHGHGGGPRPPDVFLMGVDVMDEDFWKKACEHTSRGTWSKTGRPHERAIYDEIFAPEPNRHDRSDGDLMVLFFCGESLRPMPDKYRNLLPRSWASIEAALKKGETVELTGRARGLEVVVLGAPTRSGLSGLLERTAALAPYRPESLASSGPSIGLPAGSRYVVTFDADTPRTATVRLELATASGSIVLAMAEGARHAGGYEHWLRSLSAKDERGGAFDVQGGDGHGYRLDLDGRPATVEYQVVLEHDSSPWPEGGPDEAPYATAEDVFWTGRALFLHADHAGVEVEFRLPRGWHVSAPWEAVSGRRNVFRVADERELTEAFLLAGSHAQAEVRSGEAEILLAVGRGIDDEGRGLREVVQRILDRCRDLFGGTPPGRKLLVANRDPRGRSGSLNGGVFGNSISLLSDRAFGSESTGSWAPFVAHELVHLWNGGAGLRPSGNQYWFSEGFTEYYAHVLAARLGLEDRAAFLERVRSACQAYLAHAGSVSLREAEGRELQYDGGFLAALTLDLRLRARKPSGHGLDDLMRALFARFGTAGRPYSLEDVAALAAELAGDDLERFFERHVAGTEPLPLEQDLAAAGLRFASAVASRLPEKGYAIHEVLHIRSLTETPEGLLVRKSAAAGYQDGDRLVAIGGQTVRTFGDVQRTLTDSEPGQSVSVELVRGSSTVTLPLVLGGREDPPLEHAVETSLEAGADTALLDAILGG